MHNDVSDVNVRDTLICSIDYSIFNKASSPCKSINFKCFCNVLFNKWQLIPTQIKELQVQKMQFKAMFNCIAYATLFINHAMKTVSIDIVSKGFGVYKCTLFSVSI